MNKNGIRQGVKVNTVAADVLDTGAGKKIRTNVISYNGQMVLILD